MKNPRTLILSEKPPLFYENLKRSASWKPKPHWIKRLI